jgi:hypothetical protein
MRDDAFQGTSAKHAKMPVALNDVSTEEMSEEELSGVVGGRFVYWVNAGGYRIGAWVY